MFWPEPSEGMVSGRAHESPSGLVKTDSNSAGLGWDQDPTFLTSCWSRDHILGSKGSDWGIKGSTALEWHAGAQSRGGVGSKTPHLSAVPTYVTGPWSGERRHTSLSSPLIKLVFAKGQFSDSTGSVLAPHTQHRHQPRQGAGQSSDSLVPSEGRESPEMPKDL